MKTATEKILLPIGKTSMLCSVSQRTLRYYEQIGLIQPDKVSKENGYRYYSFDTMRRIQTIRYLLDAGFSLAVIQEMMTRDDLDAFQNHFMAQIEKTKSDIEHYHQRLDSLKAWCSLVVEGKQVLQHGNRAVTSRFVPLQRYFSFEITPETSEENSSAYLETMYFTASKKDGYSMVNMGGAFNVLYDSLQDRINDSNQKITLLQTLYPNSKSFEKIVEFGGFTAISCYHIGKPDSIPDTYTRMIEWAGNHNFQLRGNCFERHVLDIYSVSDDNNYVTELLLPTKEGHEETASHSQ